MSNAEALAALRAEVTVGWRVKITDHFYLSESRDDAKVTSVLDDAFILTPRRPWSSQGRSFPHMPFTWTGDMEIDGHTVRVYRTATSITSRSYPGERQLVKTFVFSPPKEY
jgi:hypothetical protein